MIHSLLAHLYPHIRGSQEDIATYSLQYLLMQSKELNRAFTKRISDVMHIEIEDMLQYVCQSVGNSEEKERPDMAGLDSKGNETVLCEMKFYATLTPNQPNTYIDRLVENTGKGLLFVCPTARKTNLWAKLNELCKNRSLDIVDDYCVKVDGVSLAIISWHEVIERLKQVASSVANEFLADIAQLEGYCQRIDSEAFIPFKDEDISAEMASKCDRYYQVIDEVAELFCADEKHKTSKKGLKSSAYKKGYAKYLYIDNFAISLNYDRDLWKNSECLETPFWVSVRNEDWSQSDELIGKYGLFKENQKYMSWGYIFLALEPLQNSTFSEVCEDLKKQIENIMEILS